MAETAWRAFWVTAPGRGGIRSEKPCAPGAGEVLVEAVASGVSRGTETLVFRGGVPESQATAMRAPFQAGEFPAPVKYGYCLAGRVVEGGEVGQRVFCLHPHQDRFTLPAEDCIPIPQEVPDRRAVLAANMETAINAVWDAGPRLGDRIAVVGAGVVGCLAAALAARHPATRVELIDVDPARAAVAEALGARFALPDAATPEADLAIHASGSPDGLATALRLAGFEAAVLELSWYGDRHVPAPLGEDFHAKRLRLQSSQVGAVAAPRRARRTHRERRMLAMDLLRDPVFDCLITGESRFEDLPATMARLAAEPGGALCHVVTYGG